MVTCFRRFRFRPLAVRSIRAGVSTCRASVAISTIAAAPETLPSTTRLTATCRPAGPTAGRAASEHDGSRQLAVEVVAVKPADLERGGIGAAEAFAEREFHVALEPRPRR